MRETKISNKPLNFPYLAPLVFLVMAAGAVLSAYVYSQVKQNTYEELLKRTATVAELIDAGDISALKEKANYADTREYKNLRTKLFKTVKANGDVRFAYIMGLKDNQVYFIADSEPENSPDYSPPGQYYTEASQAVRDAFSNGHPFVEGVSSDRWGSWLSALAPVVETSSGRLIAVVGMDIDSANYKRELFVYTSLPVLITLFILSLFWIFYIIRKKELRELSAKAELISIASHEIRSPLNGLVWGADDLLKKAGENLPEPQRKILEMIKASCQNLLSTVNDLLDIYTLDKSKAQIKTEEVDLREILSGGVSILGLAAKEKGVEAVFDAQVGAKLLVMSDRDKLKRIFNNLISNAVKYSKNGGKVRVLCERANGRILVSIHDGGIGIPEADHEKVFAGFYRSVNAKAFVSQGTGLGLYYVKQMINRLGGKVWFESKEGMGTTFYIELRAKSPT